MMDLVMDLDVGIDLFHPPEPLPYCPSLEQVRTWIGEVGFVIEEEGTGNWYVHSLVRKRPPPVQPCPPADMGSSS